MEHVKFDIVFTETHVGHDDHGWVLRKGGDTEDRIRIGHFLAQKGYKDVRVHFTFVTYLK